MKLKIHSQILLIIIIINQDEEIIEISISYHLFNKAV